ncbi:MAG: hypothetical protein GY756_09780 [bacterium]|nr:hypothetical protein [bacterium]
MDYLKTATRSKDKTTKKYKPTVSRFFNDQTERILMRYAELFNLKSFKADFTGNPAIESAAIVEFIFPLDVENQFITPAMKPMHTSSVQKSITDINTLSNVSVNASLINPDVVLAINQLGQRVVSVNSATKKMLRQTIENSITEGTTISQLAEDIRQLGIDEYYKNRALTIARSETRLGYSEGTKISFNHTRVKTFDVVGCVGTLAGTNELGLTASYGDFSEEIGSCGVLDVDIKLLDQVAIIHHPNHSGAEVPTIQ